MGKHDCLTPVYFVIFEKSGFFKDITGNISESYDIRNYAILVCVSSESLHPESLWADYLHIGIYRVFGQHPNWE